MEFIFCNYVIKIEINGALKVSFWQLWLAITFEPCICESGDFDFRYQLIETNRIVYSLPQKSTRAQSEVYPSL